MTTLNLPEYLENAPINDLYAFVIEFFENHPLTDAVFIENHPIQLDSVHLFDNEEDMSHMHNDYGYRAIDMTERELFWSRREKYSEMLYLTGSFSRYHSSSIHFQGELLHSLAGFREYGTPFEKTLFDDYRFAA